MKHLNLNAFQQSKVEGIFKFKIWSIFENWKAHDLLESKIKETFEIETQRKIETRELIQNGQLKFKGTFNIES